MKYRALGALVSFAATALSLTAGYHVHEHRHHFHRWMQSTCGGFAGGLSMKLTIVGLSAIALVGIISFAYFLLAKRK